jgi:hypothetical protein
MQLKQNKNFKLIMKENQLCLTLLVVIKNVLFRKRL